MNELLSQRAFHVSELQPRQTSKHISFAYNRMQGEMMCNKPLCILPI